MPKHFEIPDEHRFPVQRTNDGAPYVPFEDVQKKLGEAMYQAFLRHMEDRTPLLLATGKAAFLWDLNEFLKREIPVSTLAA